MNIFFRTGTNRFFAIITLMFWASACSLLPTHSMETAVRYDNVKEVQRHLNEGASANEKYDDGRAPLHIAAQKGYISIAQILLGHGAKVAPKDKKGQTPLHLASKEGQTQMVDFLISHKAAVNGRDHLGRTPLHHAALGWKNEETIQYLLDKRARVNAADHKGITPLYLASVSGRPQAVELLINRGAKVNPVSGPAPLMGAVSTGHEEVVRVLLAHEANVHGSGSSPRTPLHVAAEKGYTRIAELLLEHKADPQRKDNTGNSPVYYAAYNDHPRVMEILFDHGVDVNLTIPQGTLLHLAAEKGHAATADLLIEKNARLEAKNSRGEKPLDVAINHRKQKIADMITRAIINLREAGK